MTDLNLVIVYWQSILDGQRYMLQPSVIEFIESTITHLKQFQEIVSHLNVEPK